MSSKSSKISNTVALFRLWLKIVLALIFIQILQLIPLLLLIPTCIPKRNLCILHFDVRKVGLMWVLIS